MINTNRANKYIGNRLKQQTDHRVMLHAMKAKREGFNIDHLPADFLFVWYVKDRRKDKDNIASAKKFVFDGLVKAKVLENDGWQQIGDINHKFRVDKEWQRVEIYITKHEE